jgi:hypothetical protein
VTGGVDGHYRRLVEPAKTLVEHPQLQEESDTPMGAAASSAGHADRPAVEAVIDNMDVHLDNPSKTHTTGQHHLRGSLVVHHHHAIVAHAVAAADVDAVVADGSDTQLLQPLLPQDDAFDVETLETGMECYFAMMVRMLLDTNDDAHIQRTRRVPARVDHECEANPTRIEMVTWWSWAISDDAALTPSNADDGDNVDVARLPRSLLPADHAAFSPPPTPFSFPAMCWDSTLFVDDPF